MHRRLIFFSPDMRVLQKTTGSARTGSQEGMLRDAARNEPYRAALERALRHRPNATVMAPSATDRAVPRTPAVQR